MSKKQTKHKITPTKKVGGAMNTTQRDVDEPQTKKPRGPPKKTKETISDEEEPPTKKPRHTAKHEDNVLKAQTTDVATWTIEQVASLAKDIGLDEDDCTKLVTGKVNGKALLSLIQRDKLVSVIPHGPASLLAGVIMPTQSSSTDIAPTNTPRIEETPAKKFDINGSVKINAGCFFVKPSNEALLKLIERNGFIMLHGHRGIGKTTNILYALEHQLQDRFKRVFITMQSVDFANFWESMVQQLTLNLPGIKSEFIGKAAFNDILANWGGKKIVMAIDEFDKVLDDDAIRLDLLDSLRGIKADLRGDGTGGYNVQSVVIIGPLSVIKAATKDATEATTKSKKGKKRRFLSPFNVSEAVSSPNFLLIEEALKGWQLDPKIPESIFNLTNGHKGLVGFCGKMLDTKFEHCPSLADWVVYSRHELFCQVTEWSTAYKITKTAARQETKSLLGRFLSAEGALEVRPKEVNACEELAAEGILSKLAPDKFEMPSKFIWIIVLNAYAPYARNVQLASMLLPNMDLDTKKLIEHSLRNFDAQSIECAALNSTKMLEVKTTLLSPKSKVPCENVYHVQMILQMRLLLSDAWRIESEVDVGTQCCDLVLSPLNVMKGRKQRVAIELVAHAREGTTNSPKAGSVREHYLRAATKYTTIDGVKEVWVINFDTNEDCNCWPNKVQSKKISAVHVFHSLSWDNVKLTFQEEDAQIQIV